MILTIDIGGTSIKYGLIKISSHPVIEYKGEIKSDAKLVGGTGIIKKIDELIINIKNKYNVQGIAISTAGMVDAEQGVIVYANENIPNYTGTKIKHHYESVFGVPCWVENDVNCAALGETEYGAGKGAKNAFMVTVGTGIGGAVIIEGNVYRGFSGLAGEVGYMRLNGSFFEHLASTTALVDKVFKLTKESELNGKTIFERAKSGDLLCVESIDYMCKNLMLGLSNCACILNPEIIILGGGIMSQKEYLEPLINKYKNEYFQKEISQATKIKFAENKNDAGMLGAYRYFMLKERCQ